MSSTLQEEITRQQELITTTFNEAIKRLSTIKSDANFIAKFHLNIDEIEASISEIEKLRNNIQDRITENKQQFPHHTIKLCRDSLDFTQKLNDSISLATTIKCDENSLELLNYSFNALHSSAKAGIHPKIKNVARSIGISLVFPISLGVFWGIVMPASLIASIALPVILPGLIVVYAVGFTMFHYCLESKARNTAKFETISRNDRLSGEGKLRNTLFAPITKQHEEAAADRYTANLS